MPQSGPDLELEYATRHRMMLELHLTGIPVADAMREFPVPPLSQRPPFLALAGPTPDGTQKAEVVLPGNLHDIRHPLAALADLSIVVDEVDRMRRNLVQECRRRERSWADIATALAVTRQSAWERYSSQDD